MYTLKFVFLSFPLALVPVAKAGSLESIDEAKEIATHNKSAIESIHTISCRYTVNRYDSIGNLTKKGPQVQYWREGSKFRSKWIEGKQWCDTIVTGLELRCSSNNVGTKIRNGVVGAYNGLPFIEGDPWLDPYIMFVSGSAESRKPPMYCLELLQHEGIKITTSRRAIDGLTCNLISALSPKGSTRAEYYFDPSVNYLIRRVIMIANSPSGESGIQMNVDRFAEPVKGIYFPSTITTMYSENGALTSKVVGEFTNIKVNEPLPSQIFSLEFQPTDRVHDLIEGKSYTVGPDGKSKLNITDVPSLPAPVGMNELTETKAEPRSFRVWLLPASIALLAISTVLIYRGRRKMRATPTTPTPQSHG